MHMHALEKTGILSSDRLKNRILSQRNIEAPPSHFPHPLFGEEYHGRVYSNPPRPALDDGGGRLLLFLELLSPVDAAKS